MYVSFPEKFCFFHNPRTGGTSFLKALRKEIQVPMQGGEHESMDYLYENFLRGSDILSSYYKFAFVRNPWDRLYSAFKYLTAGGTNFYDTRVSNLYVQVYNGDFNEFVSNHVNWFERRCHFIPYSYKCSPHLLPQHKFLSYGFFKKKLIPNFIARFEFFREDSATIFSNILPKTSVTIPHLNNSTPTDSYKDAYTDTSIDIVSKLYAKDISLFKYEFA